MSPVESAQITNLANELREFRSEFRVVKTKLFGDDETEDAQGRIPRLEAAIADQGKRINTLEAVKQRRVGAWGMIVRISAVVTVSADLLYHIFEIVRH